MANNIDGWTGNAGIRYQFTPETIAAVMPTKAPKSPIPVIGVTNWTGFYAGGFFGAAGGPHRHRVPGLAPGDQQAVGVRTDRRHPGSATTTSSATTGFSASKATSAPPTSMAVAAPALRSTVPGMTSAFFRPAGQDLLDGHGDGPRRLCLWAARCSTARVAPRSKTAASSATCFNPQGPACWRRAPNLCVNQAGVVFANGTGFGTSSTRVGWTIGYGAEFDLGKNWSAKAEYDYISFGSHTALASDGTTIMTDRADISQVKVGLNYRFAPDGGRRQVLISGDGPSGPRPDREFNRAIASGGRPISFAAREKSRGPSRQAPPRCIDERGAIRRLPILAPLVSSSSDGHPQAI